MTSTGLALMLGDAFAGWVSEYSGGSAFADAVLEKPGLDGVPRKHVGSTRYEDLTFKCGTGMSKAFHAWVATVTAPGKVQKPRDGALVRLDQNGGVLSEMRFYSASLLELGMPALDVSSKDAARMTVKLRPQLIRPGAGTKLAIPAAAVQKKWHASDFRLKIDGLDASCARVSKIDALVIRQKPTDGNSESEPKGPASLELPNLVFTVAEPHASDVYKWHEDFVIKGNSSVDHERTGTLEYLALDGTTLYTLKLGGLGIFKLTPDKTEAGNEQTRRVAAAIYCESIAYDASK